MCGGMIFFIPATWEDFHKVRKKSYRPLYEMRVFETHSFMLMQGPKTLLDRILDSNPVWVAWGRDIIFQSWRRTRESASQLHEQDIAANTSRPCTAGRHVWLVEHSHPRSPCVEQRVRL